jgi:hypothetical protein
MPLLTHSQAVKQRAAEYVQMLESLSLLRLRDAADWLFSHAKGRPRDEMLAASEAINDVSAAIGDAKDALEILQERMEDLQR